MGLTRAYRGGFEGRPGWWFSFDFNPELIAALKERIPATQRTWNEDRKEWWVAEACEPVLLGLIPAFEAYLKQGSLW